MHTEVDSCAILSVPSQRTYIYAYFISSSDVSKGACGTARDAGLSVILSEVVHSTLNAGATHFGFVVGVVEDGNGMAASHTDSIWIVCLVLDEGLEVFADKYTGSSEVVSPEGSAESSRVAGIMAAAAGEYALSDADICVVGDGSSVVVEGTKSHASFGGWVSPGGLHCATPIAKVIGIVGEGIGSAVVGIVVAPPVLSISSRFTGGHTLPSAVILGEVTAWTVGNAGSVASLVSEEVD